MRVSRFQRNQASVLVRDFSNARLMTLNRPRELNAMSTEMLHILHRHLKLEPHPAPNAVYVFRGAGDRSFCAGGDLKMLTGTGGSTEKAKFFYDEYTVDYFISQMTAPTVSLLNGFVMGSGVGLSIHTTHKIVTEKTVFSMPETTLGSFPDISSSYVFTHLRVPGVGPYLGLTGARLKGTDLVHAGLATHFVPGSSIDKLEEELCNIADPSTVADCLSAHASKDLPAFSLEKHMPLIERVFTLKPDTTVEGILEGLKSDASNFSQSLATHLETCSPTSLKVELELLKRGSRCTNLLDAYKMDYVVFRNVLEKNDFNEGVRALLVDKTKDPKWNPATLEGVSDEYVRSFFETTYIGWNPEEPFVA